MEEQEFHYNYVAARMCFELGQRPEYSLGYMRGFKRFIYGNAFITHSEHEEWMGLDGDLGSGYRDGFAGIEFDFY